MPRRMHKPSSRSSQRCSLAAPALADTLIDNANGIQVGADGKLQRFDGAC